MKMTFLHNVQKFGANKNGQNLRWASPIRILCQVFATAYSPLCPAETKQKKKPP